MLKSLHRSNYFRITCARSYIYRGTKKKQKKTSPKFGQLETFYIFVMNNTRTGTKTTF